jgi:hypothetical protein
LWRWGGTTGPPAPLNQVRRGRGIKYQSSDCRLGQVGWGGIVLTIHHGIGTTKHDSPCLQPRLGAQCFSRHAQQIPCGNSDATASFLPKLSLAFSKGPNAPAVPLHDPSLRRMWAGGLGRKGCGPHPGSSGACREGQGAQNATPPGEDAFPKYAPPPCTYGPAVPFTPISTQQEIKNQTDEQESEKAPSQTASHFRYTLTAQLKLRQRKQTGGGVP